MWKKRKVCPKMVCMVGKQRNFRRPLLDNPLANFQKTWLIRFVFSRSLQRSVFCSIWCNLSRDMGKKRKVCPKMVCMVGKQRNFRRPLLDNPCLYSKTDSPNKFDCSGPGDWSFFSSNWWNITAVMGKKLTFGPNRIQMVERQRKFNQLDTDTPLVI